MVYHFGFLHVRICRLCDTRHNHAQHDTRRETSATVLTRANAAISASIWIHGVRWRGSKDLGISGAITRLVLVKLIGYYFSSMFGGTLEPPCTTLNPKGQKQSQQRAPRHLQRVQGWAKKNTEAISLLRPPSQPAHQGTRRTAQIMAPWMHAWP